MIFKKIGNMENVEVICHYLQIISSNHFFRHFIDFIARPNDLTQSMPISALCQLALYLGIESVMTHFYEPGGRVGFAYDHGIIG
jgi:hypothetical protein